MIPNPLAPEQYLTDGILRDAAFGEFLQHMFAPLDAPSRHRLPENGKIEGLHWTVPSTMAISSGVRP
jgi:hypothetical protein